MKDDEVVDEVNSWVKNETKGLIQGILDSSEDLDMLKVILANDLYFKGTWDPIFDVSNTSDKNFYLLNGEEVKAPFMYEGYGWKKYGSFEGFKVLRLPYQNEQDQRRFSMYIYLPDERDGLKNLLQQLNTNPDEFLKHQLMLKPTTVSYFQIPKFKFSCRF